VLWVISVYFNIRNTLPKSGTVLLGHSVYIYIYIYIYISSPYRAVNTHRLGYTSQLMLYREIIAVCSQIHTIHINTPCGQNVEFVNAKLGGRAQLKPDGTR